MKIFTNITLVISLLLLVQSCITDEQKIIGIWQNERDWFEFNTDGKYNTGTGPITFNRDLDYKVFSNKKQLVIYTKDNSKTFYMQYKWLHKDSVELINSIPNAKPQVWYKVQKAPTGF